MTFVRFSRDTAGLFKIMQDKAATISIYTGKGNFRTSPSNQDNDLILSYQ